MTSALTSSYLAPAFTDERVADLLSDRFMVRALLIVEGSLADAQGQLGLIPAEAAARISLTARSLPLEPAVLAGGVLRDGHPVHALTDILREALPPEAGAWLAFGVSPQDLMDNAQVLQVRSLLQVYEQRLEALIARLAELARQFRDTPQLVRRDGALAGGQTFGFKVLGWLEPLRRQQDRLAALKPSLLGLQLAGLDGTKASLGAAPESLINKLAELLKLEAPSSAWINQRDRWVDLASWLTMTSGLIGKMAQDIATLSAPGCGELIEARAGGLAAHGGLTAAQSQRPLLSQTLVALARHSASQLPACFETLMSEQDGGGAAWRLEWLGLPVLLQTAGASLALADRLIATLQVKPEVMAAAVKRCGDLLLADHYALAMSAHMPLPQALAVVQQAAGQAEREERALADVLANSSLLPLDWQALSQDKPWLEPCQAQVDRALARLKD